MVVALTFVDSQVHLVSRFVASKERLEEQKKRKFLYRGQMGTHPNSALRDTAIFLCHLLTLRFPKLHYRNPSNTNVFYWGGKVSHASLEGGRYPPVELRLHSLSSTEIEKTD